MKYSLLICCILFAGYLSAQTVEPVLSQVESVNPFSALRVDKGLRVFVTTGNEQSILPPEIRMQSGWFVMEEGLKSKKHYLHRKRMYILLVRIYEKFMLNMVHTLFAPIYMANSWKY